MLRGVVKHNEARVGDYRHHQYSVEVVGDSVKSE